jgi:hypothetical protein
MSSEIQRWVETAIRRLNIDARPVDASTARAIISAAKAKFVAGNPRAWWMNLKIPSKRYSLAHYGLDEVIPTNERNYWFIPETEDEYAPVFDLDLSAIKAILLECPLFEYYVLHKEYRWLVAESDHNELYVSIVPQINEG